MNEPQSLNFEVVTARTQARQFATMLRRLYEDLLEAGVPANLAGLVDRLDGPSAAEASPATSRLALVVEADDRRRENAIAMLGETGLRAIGSFSAEAALALLLRRGGEVAFVFADQDLAGPRDGIAFAGSVRTLWPHIHVVVTVAGDAPPTVQSGVITLRKPWGERDIRREAERALGRADPG